MLEPDGSCARCAPRASMAGKFASKTTAAAASSYIGRVIDNRYRVVRLIGRGGMASVFLVEQVHLRQQFAMKVLHENLMARPSVLARFVREARVVSRLDNPHTVRLFDFGRYEEIFFLVMEYLEGVELDRVLARGGPLQWTRAAEILAQVCESLEEAHTRGIVHRDIKPENIMLVDRHGEEFVKVLDFGLAKLQDPDEPASWHSRPTMFGTPWYMAPEQIRNLDIDGRTDIYQAGAMGYRLVTGRFPFEAPQAFDVLTMHLSAPVPSARAVLGADSMPPAFDAILQRCMAKEPDARFESARALQEALLEVLENPVYEVGEPQTARAATEAPPEEVPFAHPGAEGSDGPDANARGTAALPANSPQERAAQAATGSEQRRPVQFAGEAPRVSHAPPVADDDELAVVRAWRRRQVGWLVAGALLAAAAGSVVVARVFAPHPPSQSVEHEPNNTPGQANTLLAGVPAIGRLGKRLGVSRSDIDWWHLDLPPGDVRVDLRVSALPAIDTALVVMDAQGEELARVDRNGRGAPEVLRYLSPGVRRTLFVGVYEEVPRGERPRENLSDFYTIRASLHEVGSPEEREPNDTPALGTDMVAGKPVRGALDGGTDVDWYRIEAHRTGPTRWRIHLDSEAQGRRVHVEVRRARAEVAWGGVLTVSGQVEFVTPESAGAWVVGIRGVDARDLDYQLTVQRFDARPLAETEPDDTPLHAHRLLPGGAASGTLAASGDVDYYVVEIPDDATGVVAVLRRVGTLADSPAARPWTLRVARTGGPDSRTTTLEPGRVSGAVRLLAQPCGTVRIAVGAPAGASDEAYRLDVTPLFGEQRAAR